MEQPSKIGIMWSNMITTIKNFIYSTVATNGAISSKRVVTISTLIAWLASIIYSIITGIKLEPMVFYGMMGVILGGAGISSMENVSQSKIRANAVVNGASVNEAENLTK